MALTNVFISPAGAGDNSGSSVANAVPAVDSNDWSDEIKALDRNNKKFVFLSGTYTVGSKLTFSGAAPSRAEPNQWVGADSNGTLLKPKWDTTGLRLDLTDYPLIVNTANTELVDTEETTYYRCLSFENTNTGYSKNCMIDASTADVDQQGWFGCNFKADCSNNNSEVMIASSSNFNMCVFESVGDAYDKIIDMRANSFLINCRVIGPSTSGSGDGIGIESNSSSGTVFQTVITRVHGHGFFMNTTNNRNGPGVTNCTIVNVGGDGINTTTLSGDATETQASRNGNSSIIFGCGAYGINVAANDTRQAGGQLAAMGSNSSGNFNNMDSYENMIDVIAVTTGDFVDYANLDFRIKRSSGLYKHDGMTNLGAIQNEDYEFVSVS